MLPMPHQEADQDRLRAIVAAAADAFALAGYHRTQMADISLRARVALGTLYRYTASKEDLFAYSLAYGAGSDLSEVASLAPIRDVESFFERQVRLWFDVDVLAGQFFAMGAPTALPQALGALYDTIYARRLTIRIVDRSAHDLPRLGEVYSRDVREPVMQVLADYLEAMRASRSIAPLPNSRASARLVLEVCAWFAMHRFFSPGGIEISDSVARETALSHLVAAVGNSR